MRRWCAIFLLCLLPLQFSWAAVAAYCGHEVAPQSQHFGHHAHVHEHADAARDAASDAASDAAPDAQVNIQAVDLEERVDLSLGINHLDCAQCHATCAALTVLPGSLALVIDRSQGLAQFESRVRTRALAPPDRPQWLPLA